MLSENCIIDKEMAVVAVYTYELIARSPIMSIGTILLIILILLLIGVIPSWPHSRQWGYGPSGVIGLIVLVLVVLLLLGKI